MTFIGHRTGGSRNHGRWEIQGKRIPNGDKVPITLCTGILRILIQHILCVLHEAATTDQVQSAMHVHLPMSANSLHSRTDHPSFFFNLKLRCMGACSKCCVVMNYNSVCINNGVLL